MSFTYSDILNDLQNITHNKLNAIPNPRVLINTAMRELFTEIDFHSAIRHSQGVDTFYDGVYRFPLPEDIKNDAILDILELKNKLQKSSVEYGNIPIEQFNRFYDNGKYSVDYHNAMKWLKLNSTIDNSKITIHEMNSLTEDGTWTVTDDGTNIDTNTSNYVSGTASISFNTTGASTLMSIVNSTLTSIDLSSLEDIGKIFIWVYLPEITNISNCTLLWGNDSSNYWSDSLTTPYNFSEFSVGWNLLAFDWVGASETGSPISTAIDYLKFTITYSSSPTITTGYLVDNIIAGLGESIELIYYSIYPWRTNNATWIQDSTTNTDYINADAEEYQLCIYKAGIYAGQAIPLSTETMNYLINQYTILKRRYEEKYPSQRQQIVSEYYKI